MIGFSAPNRPSLTELYDLAKTQMIRLFWPTPKKQVITIDDSDHEVNPNKRKIDPIEVNDPSSAKRKKSLIDLDEEPVNNTLQFKAFSHKPSGRYLTVMRKVQKNYYQLQSKFYGLYNTVDAKADIKKRLCMIDNLDERQANDLLEQQWLNDEIISQFITLHLEGKPQIAFIRSNYATTDASKLLFEGLKNNASHVRKRRQQYLLADRILWPMNDGSHWYLVIIDKLPSGRYNIYCLDSFNSDNNTYLEKAALLLQSLYPERDRDELVHQQRFIQIPNQHNLVDCGVAVCYWALQCMKKVLPKNKIGTCDYSQFRLDIADLIVQKGRLQIEMTNRFKP